MSPRSPLGGPVRGWGLRLDRGVRRTDGGRVLIGGTPLRVLRLSDRGRRWLDAVDGGDDLPADEASRRLARRLVDGGLAQPVPPTGSGPTVDQVAAIIPVHDDAAALPSTLDHLGPVTGVVVVDDGSADPTEVASAAPAARVVHHLRSLGPGVARNTGWRMVDAPFVLFVDADVQLPDGWLAGLAGHLADPTVAAVAPRVRARADRAPTWLARYEAQRSPLDLGPHAAAVRPGTRVPYVPTAALLVRRDALVAVDGFDPDLRVGEDVDLVWRLHRAGWRVRYEPSVVATHPTRPTLGAWLRQRLTYGTSAAALAQRHGDAAAPARGLSGWSALAWAAVVAGRPLAGVAVGAGTTAALVPKLRRLDDPVGEAVRLAGPGHLRAGRSVAEALRRPWWPLALALGTVRRRSRIPLVAAAVVPPLLDRRAEARAPHDPPPMLGEAGVDRSMCPVPSRARAIARASSLPRPLGPLPYLGMRWADDLAYGTGVWLGCLRARSVRALLPSFSGPLAPPADLEPDPDPS